MKHRMPVTEARHSYRPDPGRISGGADAMPGLGCWKSRVRRLKTPSPNSRLQGGSKRLKGVFRHRDSVFRSYSRSCHYSGNMNYRSLRVQSGMNVPWAS